MKNIFTFLVVGLVVLASATVARATEETADQGERVQHYEAQTPESLDEAIALLKDKTAAVGAIIVEAGENLDLGKLEQIHEISYTLEAAVDKIRDGGQTVKAETIDQIDEAVQALHYASEKHEDSVAREWFGKLDTLVAGLGQEESKETAAAPLDPNKTVYDIFIKDHVFSPEELVVPAGKKIKLKVHNQDATPEEFESHDLNREKIINGNKSATIFVGPLSPGKYHYFGEFNMDTANGYIVAE